MKVVAQAPAGRVELAAQVPALIEPSTSVMARSRRATAAVTVVAGKVPSYRTVKVKMVSVDPDAGVTVGSARSLLPADARDGAPESAASTRKATIAPRISRMPRARSRAFASGSHSGQCAGARDGDPIGAGHRWRVHAAGTPPRGRPAGLPARRRCRTPPRPPDRTGCRRSRGARPRPHRA